MNKLAFKKRVEKANQALERAENAWTDCILFRDRGAVDRTSLERIKDKRGANQLYKAGMSYIAASEKFSALATQYVKAAQKEANDLSWPILQEHFKQDLSGVVTLRKEYGGTMSFIVKSIRYLRVSEDGTLYGSISISDPYGWHGSTETFYTTKGGEIVIQAPSLY